MRVGGRSAFEPANPVGSGTVGHGRKQIELNVINTVALFDRTGADNQKRDGNAGLGVYKKSDDKQLGIVKGDFLLKRRDRGESFAYTPDVQPRVFASLNGIGKDAKLQYPSDPKRQKQRILADLDPAGVAIDTIPFVDKNRGAPAVSAKQHGNDTQMAVENMPFGAYVKLEAPDPDDPDLMDRPQNPGEHTVYNPKTVTATVAQRFRAFLEDEDEAPEDAFDEDLHEMDPYRYYFDMKAKSSIVEGLLFLRRLTRHGYRLEINDDIQPQLDVRDDPDAAIGQTDLLLGLTQAFGYLGNVEVADVEVTRENQVAFMDLRKAFMGDVLYDGSTNRHAFHYEEGEVFRWSSDLEHAENPGLRMTYLQLNHFADLLLAMVDALEEERRWIVGRVYQPAEPGGSFHYIVRN